MNIKYTQRMQRREMTADEGETLVVHIRKVLQGQHMVGSCPFMRPSTSNDDDDDDYADD